MVSRGVDLNFIQGAKRQFLSRGIKVGQTVPVRHLKWSRGACSSACRKNQAEENEGSNHGASDGAICEINDAKLNLTTAKIQWHSGV